MFKLSKGFKVGILVSVTALLIGSYSLGVIGGYSLILGTALHKSVEAGDLKGVKGLIEAGANLNIKDKSGRTPLDIATSEGYLDMVELLIENGAQLDALGKDGPSHYVAFEGEVEKVGLLVSQGAQDF